MSVACNEPSEGSLGHLQGNVNRLRVLFSTSNSSEPGTSPTQQLRHGRLRDHSPSPFQAARVSLRNIEEDLNSIHGLLNARVDSRDDVGRVCRSVSPATAKLPPIREPCVPGHEAKLPVPMRVVARANMRARSNSTPLSRHGYDRPSDRPWIRGKGQSSPGPYPGGSPMKNSPPLPTDQSPPSGYNPSCRRLPFYDEKEIAVEKHTSSADSSYSIRVDFGSSTRESLHRPKDASSNSLTHAIDTLLMVTGNDGMSARNVEEHVMEQTRMMRGRDQSNDPLLGGAPDVQSAAEVVQSLPPEKQPSRNIASVQPDLVLSVASTVGSSDDRDGSSGSSTSTVRASPLPGLGDVDRSSATQANGSLSYRPPSVRSLPASYLSATGATCHCPYCCSCGSYQKRLDASLSHHAGLHQRSPSIQSVPVYLEGASPDIMHARKSRNCPLQCFVYQSPRPSPSLSTIKQRYSDEHRSSHSSVEDLPQLRSSVKELAQSFERLAIGAQGLGGSDLSLSSLSAANGLADPQHAHLRHTLDHRRSPSLVSVTIPEESLGGPAYRHPLRSAALSNTVPGGSGNLLQMADSSRESLTSLSSQRTNTSMDPLCCSGQNLRVGVDGKVFRDRIETLYSWYKEFSDQQRNGLLSKLLDWSNCSQMRHLAFQMEPILHQHCPHNCQDLLSWLPPSISYQILVFLDPVSLCRCLLVSRNWYFIASNSQLWRCLCRLERYQLSPQGQKKQLEKHTLADGSVQWKEVFAERYRLWRNWSRGYCNIRTFEGHTQGVSCVQFDDNRIVSGSSDKTIKVWNIRTNTTWAALTLEGHSGDVRCLHLHGDRLISGSSDRTIKVWELFTENVSWLGATCRVTMVGHTHTVRCLQSDDNRVISGSYDHTLKIWDIATGSCTHTLRGHTDHVVCVQFKDDKLVSGSGDCTIIVWDLSTYEMKHTLRGHKAAVTTLQFDSSRIISGSLDRLIKIWDLGTWQCVHTLDWIHSEGHTGVIRHLQANHWKMVSAADDKTLKVWSLDSGERLLTLRSHTDGVTCVQFNDKVIVSGSYDRTVKLWDFSAC